MEGEKRVAAVWTLPYLSCWCTYSAVLGHSASRRACGTGSSPTTAEHAAPIPSEGDEEEEEDIGTLDQEVGEEEEEEENPLDRWGTVVLPDSQQMCNDKPEHPVSLCVLSKSTYKCPGAC